MVSLSPQPCLFVAIISVAAIKTDRLSLRNLGLPSNTCNKSYSKVAGLIQFSHYRTNVLIRPARDLVIYEALKR